MYLLLSVLLLLSLIGYFTYRTIGIKIAKTYVKESRKQKQIRKQIKEELENE